MKTLSLVTLASVIACPAFAETTRHAESHEHGVGQMNIAFEGTSVAVELHAPGADIVGFEYEAKSQDDKAAIDAALATLAKPLNLFALPDLAGCQVVEASAELEGEESHEDSHGDDHAHDDHDDHADEDGHDDHAEHQEHGDSHTEFHAEYLLECANRSAIDEVTFAYFDAFPNAQELELQVVSDKGASAFEIERDAPSVNLSGLF